MSAQERGQPCPRENVSPVNPAQPLFLGFARTSLAALHRASASARCTGLDPIPCSPVAPPAQAGRAEGPGTSQIPVPPSAGPAPQQFFEIISTPGPLEPLVIHCESYDDVFPQPLRGPDAELRAAVRFHPVADGDDEVEVVVIHL